MEIEVTWKHVFTVWWAFVWRNIIALVLAIILSIAASAIFALITVSLGMPKEILKIPAILVGMLLGLGATIVPLKFIINKNYKGFRLAIVKTNTEHST